MVLRWFGQRFGGFWGLGSTAGADFAHVRQDLPLLEQILSLDPRAAPRSVTISFVALGLNVHETNPRDHDCRRSIFGS